MTREAKIGMLTGLGVILLIGVLLSNYLGTNPAQGGRTVPLVTIGGEYRQEVMHPVAPPGAALEAQNNGSAVATAYDVNDGANANVVPALYASNGPVGAAVSGPTMGRAVTPIAAGPAPAGTPMAGGPPMIAVADAHAAAVPTPADGGTVVVKATMRNTTYMIAAGDTLMKIARKFYGTDAKQSDIQRIVAANPTVLKDATTMLVVGKKLVITNVPAVRAPASPKGVQPVVAAKPDAPEMISLPGSPDVKVAAKGTAGGTPLANGKAPKTYVVQAGDTLEKIARKFSPSNSTQLVAKLKSANGIKDPSALQIGTTLKVPV